MAVGCDPFGPSWGPRRFSLHQGVTGLAKAMLRPSSEVVGDEDVADSKSESVVEGNGEATGNGQAEPSGRPRRRATVQSMAASQRDISVSEFFAKNRHLLGFDNPRKALVTTVKEAVDNALDAVYYHPSILPPSRYRQPQRSLRLSAGYTF
jgi:hypothetical protein